MVSTRGFARIEILALVALIIGKTTAFPFAANPYTEGGNSFVLDSRHPALGAAPPKDSRSFDVVMPDRASNGSTAGESDMESRELTSNADIERLEAFFKSKMETNFEKLKPYAKGAAITAPWPSSYWPTYEDGINYVWSPSEKMSPSEKYARAFNHDVKSFQEKVSKQSGVLAQSARKKCKADGECASVKDGSVCAKRAGEKEGFCIPKWFGVCHAWAPAAIEEKEPRCPVTKKGVTFQPLDIKALITQAYDGLNLGTVFTGTRYNGADEPENLDEDGRYKDDRRRDIGPGFFHIALTNIMGIRQSSFIVDVSSGAEVWNQPVRSYEAVTMMELSESDVLTQLFPKKKKYDFNRDAEKFVFVQTKFDYVVESTENGPLVSTNRVDSYTTTVYYEYVLELNRNGDIIGGEWVRDSRKTHPDFLWFPESPGKKGSVSDIGIQYDEVRELLDASVACTDGDGAGGDSDSPSPAATSSTPAPSTTTVPATSSPSTTAPTSPVPSGTASTAPVPSLTSAAPAATTTAPSPTSGFDAGTVTTDDSLYAMIAEWVRRWMAANGRAQ